MSFLRPFLACGALAIVWQGAALAQSSNPYTALPAGGQVVAGSAHIVTSKTTTTLNVVQTSQRAVVNWQSFNVGANAKVEFVQPNAQAVIHNRVVSATPSQIDGMIKANGQVIISNANGVVFGKGSQVDAVAIVATTMDINDKDFMEGKSTFKGNGTGSVVNYGKLQTNDPKGYIALLAPEVRNEGYILAKGGSANTVALASGSQVTLDFRGDQLMTVKVDASTYKTLIENKRLVQVDGGMVVIAANSAAQLMGSVIKNSGRISASSMVNNGGIIEILADTVQNSGAIVANAKGNSGSQGNGGQISIKGNQITLADSSKIKANAKEQGNGGQIIVLSNKKTQVSGILQAMGGRISGNGGFIDTSSKEVLEISSTTQVNTQARNILGKAGTWLLDPMDLLITSSFAQVISDALQNNNVTVQVQGNVCSGGSCTLNGSGNLTIDQGVTITKTGSTRTILTFLADGTFFNYGTINQAADSILEVVIQAQNVNLAQNSHIEANKVTVTAVNSVVGYGSIIGRGANPLVNILANVFNFHGGITVNATGINNQSNSTPGTIRITADDLTLAVGGRLQANGEVDGGTIILKANVTGTINIEGTIQTNGGNGRGGEIIISDAHDINILNNAIIQSNADNGGNIQIFTNFGDLILQNALIQTNGSNGRGGSIGISATRNTLIQNSTIEAKGFNQGGRILIGNDAENGTLPFSIYTDIDTNSVITTDALLNNQNQINPDYVGGFIETSAHTLNLLGTINAGRGGMWLIDPVDITIDATLAASIASALSTSNVTVATSSSTSCVGVSCASNAITGLGDITISSPISSYGTKTLTFTADNQVIVNAQIQVGGALVFNAPAGIQLNANIAAAGDQTYNGAVTLLSNIRIDNYYGIRTQLANQRYNYSASLQYLTLVGGEATFQLVGAGAGTGGTDGGNGGAGGGVAGSYTVTLSFADELNIALAPGLRGANGASGAAGSGGGAGGTNALSIGSGGNGGHAGTSCCSGAGGGGGAATVIQIGEADSYIFAGGAGGGAGANYPTSYATAGTNNGIYRSSTYSLTNTNGQTPTTPNGDGGGSGGAGGGYIAGSIVNPSSSGGEFAGKGGNRGLNGYVLDADAGVTLTTGSNTTTSNTSNGYVLISGYYIDTSARGNVTFKGLVDSASGTNYSLTVNSQTKNTTFERAVGSVQPLSSLTSNTATLTAGNIKSNGAVAITNTGAASITGTIANGATVAYLTKAGAGTLSLSGNSTYTGSTTINAGSLQITTAGSLGENGSYAGNILNNADLVYASSANQTWSGVVSGAGTFSKTTSSSSVLTLEGTNTYTGVTTLSAGTIKVTNDAGLGADSGGTVAALNATLDIQATVGSEALTLEGATLTTSSGEGSYGGTITMSAASNFGAGSGATLTITSPIGGAFAITKVGAGEVILEGINTFTGNTTISAGTLAIGASGQLGSSGTYSGTIANSGTFRYGSSANQILSGIMSGTGALVKDTSTSSTLTLTAANTYSGTTTIGAGNLQVGNASTTGQLGSGAVINNGNLIFNRSNAISYVGSISGTGVVTQAGAGALTLSGNSSYSGGTYINASRSLIATHLNALAGSSGGVVNLGASASLDLQAAGTFNMSSLVMGASSSITNTVSAVANLYVAGTSQLNNAVTTKGTQTYNGAAYIGSATTLTTTNSVITFNGSVETAATTDYVLQFLGGGSYKLNTTSATASSTPVYLADGSQVTYASGAYGFNAGDTTTVEYLIVAGGGGASRGVNGVHFGAGAGGGEVLTGNLGLTEGVDYSIVVGAGGGSPLTSGTAATAGASSNYNGRDGGSSSIAGSGMTSLTANGGLGSQFNTSVGSASGNGNLGAAGTAPTGSGGGGGAGGNASGVTGGAGIASSITGSSVTYGGGGCGRTSSISCTATPTANTGRGAADSNTTVVPAGASGIVVIKVTGARTPTSLTLTTGTAAVNFNQNVDDLNLTINSTSASSSIAGVISGLVSVSYNTAATYNASALGVITVSGANTYTGGTAVRAGKWIAGSASSLGTGTVTVGSDSASVGTVDLQGFESTNTFILNGGAAVGAVINSNTSDASTISGNITIASDTSLGGAGDLTISSAVTSSSYGLAFVGGGDFALSNTSNAISTIASISATKMGSLTINNASTLTIGSVAIKSVTYTGLTSSGDITLTSQTTTSNALSSTVAISADGDINISGTATTGRGISFTGALTATDIYLEGNTSTGIAVSSTGLMTAGSITVEGNSTTASSIVSLGAMTLNRAQGDLLVTANNTSAGSNTGITQSGTITGASGSDITFVSNNAISQSGTLSLAANVSGATATVTYDTTSGNRLSTISGGTLTIASTSSTSPINYVMKSSGSALDPGTVGTSSVRLPGYISIDNTFGGSPLASGYLTTSTFTSTNTTSSIGVTLDHALYATGNITVSGISYGQMGINYSNYINSSAGDITFTGSTTGYYGVYTAYGYAPVANNITITGNTSTTISGWIVYINALTINSGSAGGNILVTATGASAGGGNGLYQAGAITGVNGSDITFVSNNVISQAGAITLAANTTATSAVTYDTTSGNKLSTINTGSLTLTSGSSQDVNYLVKSSGGAITIGGAVGVNGTITLDNTYGCATSGCTPASAYITTSNYSTLATTGHAVQTTSGTLTAVKDLTIKAISYGNYGWYSNQNTTSSTGDINVTGISYANRGISQTGTTTATLGDVTLTGQTTTQYGVYATGTITANNITVTGTATGTIAGWAVQLGAMTINAAGGDIAVTGTGASAGGANGITQSGTITGASGSDITFVSNNAISQSGTLSLAANVSGATATVTYDTTSGNRLSTISGGTLTIASTSSTSPINYVMKSSGSALDPGTVGTSSVRLPGYISIDNTFGGSPLASGYLTTSTFTSTNTTSSIGVTLDHALYATGNITVSGISYGQMGINYSNYINSSAGDITFTGSTTGYYGVYTAYGYAPVANNITITGNTSTTISGWIVYINALTINSGSAGGNILVTATGASAGGGNGLYQAGAITGVNGSDITFVSNNVISQAGAITLAANTTATSAVTYDTTSGNKLSTINTGSLTLTSGSSQDVNYLVKSSGGAITIGGAVGVNGTITLDNTYGCATSGCTPASAYITTSNYSTLATTGHAVQTTSGTLTAVKDLTIKAISYGNYGWYSNQNTTSSTGDINVTGISYANRGISQTGTTTATLGDVTLTGQTTTQYGVYATGTITANNITVTGTATGTIAGWAVQLGAMTINAAGGDIAVTGTGASAGGANGITQSGTITGASGSDITFVSNNVIDQSGAINLVANATANSAAVTFDTTSGNRLSNISMAAISTSSGTNTSVTDVIVIARGARIVTNAISVKGSITLDNSYGGSSGVGGAPTSLYFNATNNTTSNVTSAGHAITIGGALSAGTGLTIRGINSAQWGMTTSSSMSTTTGDIDIVGVGISGVYVMHDMIATAGAINVSSVATSNVWSFYAQNTSSRYYIAGTSITINAYSTTYSSAINIQNVLLKSGTGDITLSARGGTSNNGAVSQNLYLAAVVVNSGRDFIIQGSVLTNGIATGSAGAAVSTSGFMAVDLRSTTTLTYSGSAYSGFKATRNITIMGASTSSYAVYVNGSVQSTSGLISVTGTSTNGYGVELNSATITSGGGIAIYGRGTAGSITGTGLITNTGGSGTGIIINATGNVSVAAITNSGNQGIRVTGGQGIAAGTVTGGTITGLGTITNTGGVVAISMAQPRSNNSYDFEGKLGITALTASEANVRYSVAGGDFTQPSGYSTGNYINYRSGLASYTATVSLLNNYSAIYGTAFNSSDALTWLRSSANTSVTVSGGGFGVSVDAIRSGLVWNSTIGSSNTNANAVQTATTINTGSIKTATGASVTITGTAKTYTITKASLTITNNSGSATYDGTTTYAQLVGGAGYSLSGLVTEIGGVSTGDAVNSVTQTIKTGTTLGSGTTLSGSTVITPGDINAVPGSASGTGLANYTISYVGNTYSIAKAALTIAASNDSKVYGSTTTSTNVIGYNGSGVASASSGVGYSITSGRLIGSDSLTGITLTSTGGLSSSGVVNGGYSIVPSSATGTNISYYDITYNNGTMTVTPKAITVTANRQTTEYGTALTLGSVDNTKFTNTSMVGSDSITGLTLSYLSSSSVPATVNAGSYAGVITPSAATGSFNADNYTFTYVAGNLVVNPKALTISLANQTKEYDATVFQTLSNASYSISGLVNGNSLTINQAIGTFNSKNVADASTVTASLTSSHYVAGSGTNLSNYVLPTSATGTGTISAATLTVTASAASKFVGQADGSFTYTYSGLKGDETISSVASSFSVTPNRSTSVTIRSADNTTTTGVMPAAGSEAAGKTYVGVLVPTASGLSSNYTLNAVAADYSIAAAGQLIISVGNSTATYGTYSNSSNLAYEIRNSVTAAYCRIGSACGAGDIQTLTNTNVSTGANHVATFTARDSLTPDGVITFNVGLVGTPTYSSGNFLNVASYTMTPSAASPALNSSSQTQVNYLNNDPAYPVLYNSGVINVRPLTVTVSNGSAPTKQYDTTTSLSGVVITPTNKLTGDTISLSGFGVFSSPNAGTGLSYTISNIKITGADSANYVLGATTETGTNGVITKAPVTLSGLSASNKSYDGSNTATISGTPIIVGLLGSDTSSITGSVTAGTFASANALSNQVVTPTLSGISLGNSNYSISGLTSELRANIDPARITVTVSKSYDGSTTVNTNNIQVAGVNGETLSLAAGTATLTSPNVGMASLSGLNSATLADGSSGTIGLASNYTTSNPIFSTVTITPANLTVSASNAVKTYNQTTDVIGATTAPAAIVVSGTLFNGDALSGGTFAYTNANASVGDKTLTVSGVSVLNGALGVSANYSISYANNTTSTINKAPITVTGLSVTTKAYDGGRVATITGTPAIGEGFYAGDTATITGAPSTGTFASANVGENINVDIANTLTIDNPNYYVSGVAGGLTGTITPKTVTLSATKTYDGNIQLGANTVTISTGVGSETLTYRDAVANSANVGSGNYISEISLLDGTNGGLASNYQLPTLDNSTAAVTINKKTVSLIAEKVYDSSTSFSSLTLDTGVAGQTLSYSGVTSNDANVATANKYINAITLADATDGSGGLASNYQLPSLLQAGDNNQVTITARELTFSGTPTREYNGSTAIDASSVTLLTGVGTQTLTISNVVANSANVGSGNYIASLTLADGANGGIASNYQLPTLNATSAPVSITAKTVTLTGSKTYDGSATLTGSDVTISTGVGSETLTFTGATASDANAGSRYISAITLVDGTGSAANYQLPTLNISNAPLTINKATLTVTAADATMTYGDNSLPTFTSTIAGYVNNETSSVFTGAAAYTTTATAYNGTAGSGSGAGTYTVTPTLGTLASDNYQFSYEAATLTINKATVTITASSDSKVYGSTTTGAGVSYSSGVATGATAGFTSAGLVNGDLISSVTLTSLGGNADATVLGGPYVVTPSSLGGAGATRVTSDNYTINYVAGSLTVTPKTVTISASKTYDGSATLTGSDVTISTGVGSETLTFTGATASDANAGSRYISAITLVDGTGSAANYQLPTLNISNAPLTINKATLTVTAADATMTYGDNSLPTFTSTIAGYVNNETSSVFTGAAAYTTTATAYNGTAGSGSGAGTYTVTPTLGTLASDNYQFSYEAATLTINKATVTITASSDSKVYGSTTTGAGVSYSSGVATGATAGFTSAGLVNGDLISSVTLTSLGGNADATVLGGPYVVTPSSLGGAGATRVTSDNYTINYVAGSLTVTPKTVTISASKTYDGSTGLTGSQVTISTGIAGQTLSYSGAISSDANVATANKYISAITLVNGTGDASNYQLPTLDASNAPVTINPKTVSLSATKTYDGSTGLTDGQVTISTGIAGETLTYSGATASDANVATANKYISAMTLADGTGLASNYQLPTLNASNAPVTIDPKTVTLSATKTYDGTTALTGGQVTIETGIVGETLSYSGATASDANVATADKYISAITLTDTGSATASNYQLPVLNANNAAVTIGKADYAVTANTEYTGSTQISADRLLIAGVNGEIFTLSGYASLASRDVQSNQALADISQLVVTAGAGASTSNYNALSVADTSITITPKVITLTPPSFNKVYDGVASYVLSSSDLENFSAQLSAGDRVTAAVAVFSGNNANAGNNKPITIDSLTIDDGNNGQNYQYTIATGTTGNITPAPLTIQAANDAKFVTQTDTSGYAGAHVKGFVNNDTISAITGSLIITRSDAGNDAAGTYALTPSGYGTNGQQNGNYQINYQNGTYTIVPADGLIVRAASNTSYGSNPSYSFTAAYLAGTNTLGYIGNSTTSATAVTHTVLGNQTISLNDGRSGGVNLGLEALNPVLSGSGSVSVGQYDITSTANTSMVGNNYSQLVVLGQLSVTPLTITVPSLSGTSISKVYDGNYYLNNQAINTAGSSSQILSGDLANITATGTYSDKNVGTNKAVTVNFSLSGADRHNYILSASQVSGNYGEITQLDSVTYTGATGGNWSSASNWAGGAIPDLSNVANVIIPINKTVVYDDDVAGPVTSNLINSGLVDFDLSNATNIQMDISGTGNLKISGAGVITLSGDNSYSGTTTIVSGSKLIAGSNSALGTNPQIITDGGYFGTAANIDLPSLNVSGGTVYLTSDITTVGAQSYDSIVLAKSNTTNTLSLETTDADITIRGTIDDSIAKTSSLVIDAGTGDVILGDSIGETARFQALTVTGSNIYILADILTGTTQDYIGSIWIGDKTYIGGVFEAGFLFDSYRSYFVYGSGAAASSYDYKNNDPRYVRSLISDDPQITFSGTVDDVTDYTHTLLVAAITQSANPTGDNIPIITFEQPVSFTQPLYSLNIQAVKADPESACAACHIVIKGGANTYAGQTYKAGFVEATAVTTGGDVVFSVYDTSASVNFLLPLNADGQVDLRNPGSLDGLIINGLTNFVTAPNLTGYQNWGRGVQFQEALGAIPQGQSTDVINDLRKLKLQAELTKEENLVVGEVTIEEIEEGGSIDCVRQDRDQPLDPRCEIEFL